MDWNTYNYTYLRPPQQVFEIRHTKDYIHQGEGKKAFRKLFYKVNLDPAEKEKLRQFKEMIIAEKIVTPTWWNDSETLKVIYACKWNLKECIKHLKDHLIWATDPAWHTLTPEAARLLEQGIVYTLGKDKDWRPIIHIAVYKFDLTRMNLDHLMKAICFALDVIKKNCFVPGYVENWILIFETREVGLFAFPFKILGKIISLTQDNYISTVEKIFVLHPSFALNASWSVISSMVDQKTVKKIGFVKKKDYHKLQEYIPKSMLEKKYGGDLPDVESGAWPPPNIYKHKPYLWPWETAPLQPPSTRDGPLSSGANPPLEWGQNQQAQSMSLMQIESQQNKEVVPQTKYEEQKLGVERITIEKDQGLQDSKGIKSEHETSKMVGGGHELEHQQNKESDHKNGENDSIPMRNEEETQISHAKKDSPVTNEHHVEARDHVQMNHNNVEPAKFHQSQGDSTKDESPEYQLVAKQKVPLNEVKKTADFPRYQDDGNPNNTKIESDCTQKSSVTTKINRQNEEVEVGFASTHQNKKISHSNVRSFEPQLEGPAPETRLCGYCYSSSGRQQKPEDQQNKCAIF